jgi:hypothetical protein
MAVLNQNPLEPESRGSTSDLTKLVTSLDASTSISEFINTALSSSLPSPNLNLDLSTVDRSVSDLLARLSILTHDTSSQLERSIHDISRTVPRLTYDLQYMRESAEGVRRSLEGVESRLKRPGPAATSVGGPSDDRREETTRILDRLTRLDTLKHNLTDARSVLREAESWSTLETETSNYLSSGKYRQAANRLAEASESIHMFQRSPKEYDLRKGLLVSLQNQLEAELDGTLAEMASVGKDISSASIMETKRERDAADGEGSDEKEKMDLPELLKIFSLIEREGEYRSIYFNARRKTVVDAWNEAKLVEVEAESTLASDSTTAAQHFLDFLPNFFSTFLSTLRTESSSMRAIFSDPVVSLSTFFQTTLEALEPSLSRRLALVAEYHAKGENPDSKGELGVLLEAWQRTIKFGKDVQDVLDALFYETYPQQAHQGPTVLTTSPGHMVTSPSSNLATSLSTGRRSRSGSLAQNQNQPEKKASRRLSRTFGAAALSSGNMIPEIDPQPASSVAPAFPSVESVTGQWDTVLYEPFLQYQTDYLALEKRAMTALIRSEAIFTEPASMAGRAPGERLLTKGSRVIEIAEEALERCTAFTLGFGLADLLEAVAFLMETFLHDSKGLLELKGGVGAVKSEGGSRSRGTVGMESLDDLDDLADIDLDLEDAGSDELTTFKLGLGVLRSCSKLKGRVEVYSQKVDLALGQTSRSLNALAQGTPIPSEGHIAGVTKGAPTLLKQSSLHQLALLRLMDGQPSIEGLLPAVTSIIEFTKDAQAATQKAIVAPIQAMLAGYPSLPSWSQPDKVARRGELHVPTFSLSPTDTISTVTEGLLDLLRLFEGFAHDEGLGFSLGTLPHVNSDLLQTMTQAVQEDTSARPQHHRTISTVGSFAAMNEKLGLSKSPGPSTPLETTLPQEVILSTWVSSTTSGLLDQFTSKILPEIKRPLTNHGATQLATDLSYLGNATRAMDVESQHLECWRESCETKSSAELKELMAQETFVARSPEAVDIARYIGWLRNWTME